MMPLFVGAYTQRGFGSPSLWLRTVKPFLKRVGNRALKHGVRLGLRVVKDMKKGTNFKDSIRRRAEQSLLELAAPSGRGVIKRKTKHRVVSKSKRLRHDGTDIFG